MPRLATTCVLVLFGWGASALLAAETSPPKFSPEDIEFFEKEVRPILAKRCHECHGATKEAKGGLRTDSRATLLAGGDTGPAIVPGDPTKSLLVDAINYGDTYQMPPKSKLPAEEIAVLTKWVQRGAPWPDESVEKTARSVPFDLAGRKAEHWCWQPVSPVAPPTVRKTHWPIQDLDRFILAALEQKGLQPAAQADRHVLARRVFFDLIGLPPSPEQLRAFLQDESPDAYEKLVDGLLDSPHFGERWARHWMDLVRYAETCGHEFDYPIHNAWQYRDYLIRAFNADLPYDQFILEHIAGDLLPQPRMNPDQHFNESIIGTAFWWLHEAIHAPVDVRGDQAGRIDNQIDVFSKTFLGLTVACARCHDHKFDAISTKDYYSLAGFLVSTRRQEAFLDPGNKIRDAAEKSERARVRFDELLNQWLKDRAQKLTAESIANYLAANESVVQTLARPSNPNDPKGTEQGNYRVFARFDGGSGWPAGWSVTGEAFGSGPVGNGEWDFRSERPQPLEAGVAHSGRLSTKFQGVLRSPTFTIENPNIFYRIAGEGCEVRLIIDGHTMIEFHQLLFGGTKFPVNTGGKWTWHRQAGDLGMYVGHRAHIEIIDHGDGWVAVDEIGFSESATPPTNDETHPLSHLAHNGQDTTPQAAAPQLSQAIVAAVNRVRTPQETQDDRRIVQWLLTTALLADKEAIQEATRYVADARSELASLTRDLPAPMRVVAAVDGTGENERIFIRGNPKILGDVAPRQLLTALVGTQPSIEQGSGRLVLARQVADPANPLTSRVMVNRVWHHLFGTGLVPSTDNFGVLGEPPVHRELLDNLAHQFVTEGWSVKRLIRSIVLSRTYQMSSTPDTTADEADPHNHLWHRRHIRRLEGEAIRDAMLAISGRLDPKPFGPSVAVHITPFMQGRGKPGTSGPIDGDGRRSLYLEVRRNFLSPMMLAFDTPIPFNAVGRRNSSNVPAQALILMNDPFVLEQAKRWSENLLAQTSDVDARIEQAFMAAVSRPPTDAERLAMRDFLHRQAAEHQVAADAISMNSIVWSDMCHVLFNLKEFIFVQ